MNPIGRLWPTNGPTWRVSNIQVLDFSLLSPESASLYRLAMLTYCLLTTCTFLYLDLRKVNGFISYVIMVHMIRYYGLLTRVHLPLPRLTQGQTQREKEGPHAPNPPSWRRLDAIRARLLLHHRTVHIPLCHLSGPVQPNSSPHRAVGNGPR